MTPLTKASNSSGDTIMSPTRPCCTSAPSSSALTRASGDGASGTTHGPSGQNVSKLLARVHCPSSCCRSRAVTSLPQV